MSKDDEDLGIIGLILLALWLLGKFGLPFGVIGKPKKDKEQPPPEQPPPTPSEEPDIEPTHTPIPMPELKPTLEPYGIPTIDTLRKLRDTLPQPIPIPDEIPFTEPIEAPTPTPLFPVEFEPLPHPLEPERLVKDVLTIGGVAAPFLLPALAPIVLPAISVGAKRMQRERANEITYRQPVIQTQTTPEKISSLLNPKTIFEDYMER